MWLKESTGLKRLAIEPLKPHQIIISKSLQLSNMQLFLLYGQHFGEMPYQI
jgi:hypothetical protein